MFRFSFNLSKGFLWRSLSWFGLVFAFASAMETSILKQVDFMHDIQEECANATGSDRAYQELIQVLNQEMPRCFVKYVNMSYLQAPVDELEKPEQTKMLTEICDQIGKSLTCIDPVVEKLKPCIKDSDDLDILQKIVDTVPEALKMICNGTGEMLMKLREPVSRSCAVELAPAIDECMDLMSNKTMEMDLKSYSQQECKEIYMMQGCLSAKIQDCGAESYLELFDLFYRNLLALTPCG
ncbi:uncharacterized protein LOC129757951 [Uranotaenia lowii]|uniref:uncharacterized protein LOC129757951 n=1 Tax=Uranotaenia lowii TaxID=190385 RepID=UPI0024784745|nr:uncharacterized protein LOC129757951 [Uranotaenia lowii]